MSFAKKAVLLLGRCVQVSREEGIEVIVTMRELDSRLKMFFPERYTFYAYDPKDACKVGDIILMKKLEEPLTRKISHEILDVIYPLGDVTDPISGKKVVHGQYREHMYEMEDTFGPGRGFSAYRKARAKETQQQEKQPET